MFDSNSANDGGVVDLTIASSLSVDSSFFLNNNGREISVLVLCCNFDQSTDFFNIDSDLFWRGVEISR